MRPRASRRCPSRRCVSIACRRPTTLPGRGTGRHAMEGAVTNPFDDESAMYLVLTNEEGRYSLWPAALDIPKGWTAGGPPAGRRACLEWIDANWTDLRPRSLREAMASTEQPDLARGRHGDAARRRRRSGATLPPALTTSCSSSHRRLPRRRRKPGRLLRRAPSASGMHCGLRMRGSRELLQRGVSRRNRFLDALLAWQASSAQPSARAPRLLCRRLR